MSRQPPYRTGDQALVREINLALILNRLWEHSPISRAALAEMTGLNKSTVSSLVYELIEQGFVREVGLHSTGIGRPSRLLEVNPSAGFIVSAEIGVDFIVVLCADFAADVLWQHRENTRGTTGQSAVLDRATRLIEEAVRHGADPASGRTTLLGLALGLPGLIDQASGTLLFAPNLGWSDVPLRDHLAARFPDTRIFVDNEANLAALGETFFGAAQGYREVLYISAGVGLGGAVVSDNQLLKGATGFAGEIGHMTVERGGRRCNCGNRGCWETQVSQSAVFRQIAALVEGGRSSRLDRRLRDGWRQLTLTEVVEAADAGDAVALETLGRVGHDLGTGVASLVNVFNPDLVLLGGILSLAHAYLLPPVRDELARRALHWSAAAAEVRRSQYGPDACVMGGVALVYQTILAQPGTRPR